MEKLTYRDPDDTSDEINDVVDGDLHRAKFAGRHFRGTDAKSRDDEIHVSLQMNTDGVAIFRWGTFSIWPIYATVNELPRAIR